MPFPRGRDDAISEIGVRSVQKNAPHNGFAKLVIYELVGTETREFR
jgi:hypothetical protein